MISVPQAIELIESNISTATKINLPLRDALGYVLAADIISPINMPPFRQSAMDGYALNIGHTDNYQIIDEVKAGDGHHPILKKGEAVRIFTGAAVPDTANAVIMQEKTLVNNSNLSLQKEVNINENIRPLGEQVKKDNVALKKNTKLTPAGIAFLSSLGLTEVDVYKQPTIAIVVTGNELTNPGDKLEYGKIFESNSIMLSTALNNSGYTNVSIHNVDDNYIKTKELLNTIINDNDMVLITGGISVGDYDFVGKALRELSVSEVFYKVKQKPGKPLFFGKKENTTIFALPGNPAAALSCFYIYAYPALQKMSGNLDCHLKKSILKSASSFTKKGNRAQFLKALVTDSNVTILEGQSSAMLQTFALANALVFIPENLDSIAINDDVEVIHLPI